MIVRSIGASALTQNKSNLNSNFGLGMKKVMYKRSKSDLVDVIKVF